MEKVPWQRLVEEGLPVKVDRRRPPSEGRREKATWRRPATKVWSEEVGDKGLVGGGWQGLAREG